MQSFAQVLDILSNGLSVALALAILVLTWLAGRQSGPERFFVLTSLRRSGRLLRRQLRQLHRLSPGRAPGPEHVPALEKHVRALVEAQLAGTGATPAETASSILDARSRWDALDDLELVARLARQAAAPERQSVVARLAWPESLAAARDAYVQLSGYLSDAYLHKSPLDEDRPSGGDRRFADLVSAFTGAHVLADGQLSRSGVIDQVQVISHRTWDGPARPHPPLDPARAGSEDVLPLLADDSGGPASAYERRHATTDATRLLVGDAVTSSGLRPGDYDGRIFSIRSVEPVIDRGSGSLVVSIEANDACYTVSERHPDYRCKHLPSDLDLGAASSTPRFERATSSARRARVDDRVVLLNTILGVLVHEPAAGGDDSGARGHALALARRTGRAKNAHDVVSATAGGVFENRRGDAAGDVDEFGAPSPLVSVVREADEELGVRFDPVDVAAQAVFLANVQGRPDGDDRENGQLVGTVCYLVESGMTLDELRAQRGLHADWSRGRYELEELDALRFPPVDGPESRGAAAREFTAALDQRLDELDQNAVVCALYAAAHLYGHSAVSAAVTATFEHPWWTLPWRGDATGAVRVVRHPRALLGAEAEAMCRRQPALARFLDGGGPL